MFQGVKQSTHDFPAHSWKGQDAEGELSHVLKRHWFMAAYYWLILCLDLGHSHIDCFIFRDLQLMEKEFGVQ